jgi:hypothetical protein
MKRGDIVVYTSKDNEFGDWQELQIAFSDTEVINIFGEVGSTQMLPGEYEQSIVTIYTKLDAEWQKFYNQFCEEAADWKQQVLTDINVTEQFVKELGQ